MVGHQKTGTWNKFFVKLGRAGFFFNWLYTKTTANNCNLEHQRMENVFFILVSDIIKLGRTREHNRFFVYVWSIWKTALLDVTISFNQFTRETDLHNNCFTKLYYNLFYVPN